MQLKSYLAKVQILREDDIKPTQPGSEANQIAQRDPRLRSEHRWELNAEVVYERCTPLRLEKPAGRVKGDCRQYKDGEKNEVRERAE